ncbi:MAG: flagellar basal body L-ring protein FlgH [Sphingomonadales bacterium]|nr:flagellar basal body L-ring protein FlgH [Sphingomonadales bacterium]
MKRLAIAMALSGAALMAAPPCHADDLYKGGNWPALAADRKASRVGDLVTIQVLANSSASNTVSQSGRKGTSASGSINAAKGTGANSAFDRTFSMGSDRSYDGMGTNARANRMAAQLSATVTEVLPNGDLVVSGWQALDISGEKTNIKVTGRIRPEDINADNAVLSSRLAEARIEYNGRGFASRSAKPGIVVRIFNFLGLI